MVARQYCSQPVSHVIIFVKLISFVFMYSIQQMVFGLNTSKTTGIGNDNYVCIKQNTVYNKTSSNVNLCVFS